MLKLARFLKPFRVSAVAIVILLFLQAMSELYLPTLMSDIVDIGIVRGDTSYILRVGGFMLAVALGGAALRIVAGYLSAKLAAGFGNLVRSALFTKVENFSLHEFDQFGTASLITRATNDVSQVQQVTAMMFRMMITAPLMGIGGIVMAVIKNARLSLVLVVVVPILASVLWYLTRKGIPLFKLMQKRLDRLNLVMREALTGVRVIRAFNRTEYERRRFNEANTDLTDTAITVNRILAINMPLMQLLMNVTTVAVIWFGGIRIDNGAMQVGDLMAFIQYLMQIMFSLVMASMMFVTIPRASVSAGRINEVLETVPEIQDPPAASGEGVSEVDDIRGTVEFKDVTFSYPGAEVPALHRVSFYAGPGEVTAIIGGTGSGKTTLINLIPRFYDVGSGSILVDGVDVRQMSQADLRAKIGLVPQNAVLFTGTIDHNIRYGKENASFDSVEEATRIAQAAEFISGMKEGYDTVVAQGGTNVSGGQKQRLSIARALVRRPEIYLFDDSFSALDFKTDAKLRAALRESTSNATVIIVAQRVSTVMHADRIVVLDEGKVVGKGTHRELLGTCQVYREIVSSQLSEEELA